MIELTVLIPCLNEEDTIKKCIKKAKLSLKKNNIKGEILVIDNGISVRLNELSFTSNVPFWNKDEPLTSSDDFNVVVPLTSSEFNVVVPLTSRFELNNTLLVTYKLFKDVSLVTLRSCNIELESITSDLP